MNSSGEPSGGYGGSRLWGSYCTESKIPEIGTIPIVLKGRAYSSLIKVLPLMGRAAYIDQMLDRT